VDVRLYGPVDLVVVEEEEDDKEGDGEESGPFDVGIDAVVVTLLVRGNPLGLRV
jgi:hypothetical protein